MRLRHQRYVVVQFLLLGGEVTCIFGKGRDRAVVVPPFHKGLCQQREAAVICHARSQFLGLRESLLLDKVDGKFKGRRLVFRVLVQVPPVVDPGSRLVALLLVEPSEQVVGRGKGCVPTDGGIGCLSCGTLFLYRKVCPGGVEVCLCTGAVQPNSGLKVSQGDPRGAEEVQVQDPQGSLGPGVRGVLPNSLFQGPSGAVRARQFQIELAQSDQDITRVGRLGQLPMHRDHRLAR